MLQLLLFHLLCLTRYSCNTCITACPIYIFIICITRSNSRSNSKCFTYVLCLSNAWTNWDWSYKLDCTCNRQWIWCVPAADLITSHVKYDCVKLIFHKFESNTQVRLYIKTNSNRIYYTLDIKLHWIQNITIFYYKNIISLLYKLKPLKDYSRIK